MNIPSKEDTIKKWAPILESVGITGSKADWMSEYAEMHSKNETTLSNTTTEMESIRQDVKIENRDRKIESIVEDKEFEEMKVEDHPDYKGPSGQLFYMDFKYVTQSDVCI